MDHLLGCCANGTPLPVSFQDGASLSDTYTQSDPVAFPWRCVP